MITTRLNDEGTEIGDSFSSLNCSKQNRLYKLGDVKKAWESFSKVEKEQALAFLAAHSKPIWEDFPYWFLTTYRNHDTGRTHKAAGCSEKEPGIGLGQLKRYLGVK